MHPQRRSWAIIPGTTSSPELCRPTPIRPRPCWTSWLPWAGTTSPRWHLRGIMGRAEWRLSFRSHEKAVSFQWTFWNVFLYEGSRLSSDVRLASLIDWLNWISYQKCDSFVFKGYILYSGSILFYSILFYFCLFWLMFLVLFFVMCLFLLFCFLFCIFIYFISYYWMFVLYFFILC